MPNTMLSTHLRSGYALALLLAWPFGHGGAASAQPASEPLCREASTNALPAAARESSGLAGSPTRPGVLWTHNDQGNPPYLYAIDDSGRLLQTVRVPVRAIDWEDVASGTCPGGSCLYVGDIGDNDANRDAITIYRISEPAAGATASGPVVALQARFPDGPADAESLFVVPSGDLYVVTKGRRREIALYRYPSPERPEEIVVLERVRELFPEPKDDDDRVTAATSTPDGRWIGVRTYRALYLYDARRLLGGDPVEPTVVDLEPLGEGQGEGLAMANDGTVWLSSEAANKRSMPQLTELSCTS